LQKKKKKKKIRTNKTVTWEEKKSESLYEQYESLTVEEPCDWLIPSRSTAETYGLHLQDYKSIQALVTLKMISVLSFETSDRNYPNTGLNNHTIFIPKYENKFVTSLSAVSFPVYKASNFPLD
jgi:hypothetical protein